MYLNVILTTMQSWFTANKLSLNVDKTCYTVFHSKCKPEATDSLCLKLYINNQLITKVSSCKYLGVVIDESLKWKKYIDQVYVNN